MWYWIGTLTDIILTDMITAFVGTTGGISNIVIDNWNNSNNMFTR